MTTTVERGQRLRLLLESMGPLGDALAHHEGREVLVFGGIPGEEVIAEVVRYPKRYIAAQVVEVVTPSPHRVATPCPYVGDCTGCQWQHISYDHQLHLKREAVLDALHKVGGLSEIPVPPTLPSDQQFGYRNHARFTIGPEGRLGFVHRERRRFVDIQRCLLMDPWINETLDALQGRCGETTQLSMRYGSSTGEWLIQPTLKSTEVPLETGQKHYRERLLDTPFRIAASSFFQTNTGQAERLARLMLDALSLSGGEVVVDSYAGVGTFAALLAPHAARVIAIEESASAIQDAEQNLAAFSNVEIRPGKTEDVLDGLDMPVDAAIVDPPRVGCHPRTLESLMRLAPPRLVYISCDPVSLARDLKILSDGPYRVESVQPVDMFPQTHHVECLTTLTLKSPASPAAAAAAAVSASAPASIEPAAGDIILASASPRRLWILERAGVSVTVRPSPDPETPQPGEPEAQVEAAALAKARSVATPAQSGLVLGADTVVVDGDTVLGKPRDREEALHMLRRLRGRQHRVLTAVAVVDAASGRTRSAVRESRVTMRPYTDDEMEAYVASGAAQDKAGAYAIQDPGFHPVAALDGCYLNVVGLPLCSTISLLREACATLDHVAAPQECAGCPLREPAQ
ncbi:MAG: Maf family nucleotide pyrophosphatase [Chloroflexi bacterium]|nr:Maf family nucleotide pyrophosphatase [Chloroflexota bacterium]